MAIEYEIEWTETMTYKVRIQAPPNDGRMIEAAKTGEVIVWAKMDVANKSATIVTNFEPETTLTKIGRVVKTANGSERVDPL